MNEPKVPVGVTNRYLRLIHRFYQPQKYRYEDESVPMLALVPGLLRAGTFGMNLWRVF